MDRVARRCCGFAVVVGVVAGSLAAASGALASRWSIQPVANPLGQVGRWGLSRVSCGSPNDCIASGLAGGTGAVEYWNGTEWSFDQPLDALEGVSCVSGRGCVVVGTDVPRGSGVRWSIPSILSIPASNGGSYLSSLSCASSTACTAIGQGAGPTGLVEHWNGKTWAIQRTPKVGHNDYFAAVSCPSASTCILVGSYGGPGGTLELTERWNGTNWSLQRSPSRAGSPCQTYGPAKFCSELTGVSCASPAACIAIGQADSASTALVERWNGRTWSMQRAPNTGRGVLYGVSCSSATTCTAVGGNRGRPLAERWNGKRWSLEHPVSGGDLSDVSCPLPTDCIAVGFGSFGPLAERWTGTG